MKKIELLAPAGSWEALKAAVQNGADAVYLGGTLFSARQYANNFNQKELSDAVKYCHVRDVKVFVTVNTLVLNEEMKELAKHIAFLYNIDVDAVIIQDLGVAKFIREFLPDLPIHASTQMSIHNYEGVKLLEEIGVKRVVLAREMTKEEIVNIRKNTNMDIEIFVHGALCVSYSGQCLMSSIIGRRSGNRGRCAQPCRMPYALVDLKKNKEIQHSLGNYILSPRDLNTIENINEILKIGVHSLKIEGRMKRPEYVAVVVGAYRKIIDRYLESGIMHPVDDEILKDLKQIFNRRFTKGYLLGEQGKRWMSFSKPNNRGRMIGRVVNYNKRKRKVQVQLEDVLSKGDGIEIHSGRGDGFGTIIEDIIVQGKNVEQAYREDVAEFFFKFPVKSDNYVYKTSDLQLLQKAQLTYNKEENKIIPLYGKFKGELGSSIEISLWDNRGNFVSEKGEGIPTKASKTPTSKERIQEQLTKLGGTPYELDKLDIEWDDGLFIPVSELNQLRRDAVGKLDLIRKNFHNRRYADADMAEKRMLYLVDNETVKKQKVRVSVKVQNIKQLKTVLKFPVNRVYYSDFDSIQEALELSKNHSIQVIPNTLRIMHNEQIDIIKEKINHLKDACNILVSDLGMFNMLRKIKDFEIITDFGFNVFNNVTVKFLQEMGAKEVTLSPELTLKQMESIVKRSTIPCEAIIHGHIPLMIMKYCPLSTIIGCTDSHSCTICRSGKFGLKDRKGIIFPLLTNPNCKVEVLNSKKLCMIEHIEELIKANLTNLRIQFTIEDEEEIERVLHAYLDRIDNILLGKQEGSNEIPIFIETMKQEGFTRGHFFRGVE